VPLDARSATTIYPPPLPAQDVGPHFEIGAEGVIDIAPPSALDEQGNHIDRMRSLHPVLRKLASELVDDLSAGNQPHAHLRERCEGYFHVVDRDLADVNLQLLYVEGVRLANAENAAAEKIAAHELPPLSASTREAIDSLIQLHGTFMLSTAEGAKALELERQYQVRPQEEEDYRLAAVDLAESLQGKPDIITPLAAGVVLGAVEQIGRGLHPERSGVAGTGTIWNVTIALAGAATVAALPLVGELTLGAPGAVAGGLAGLMAGESLKKSAPFSKVIGVITGKIDGIGAKDLASDLSGLANLFVSHSTFFSSIEPKLRRLSKMRRDFAWIGEVSSWVGNRKRLEVPRIKPVVIIGGGEPVVEKKRGWWRR
jgi:hypothetical protein